MTLTCNEDTEFYIAGYKLYARTTEEKIQKALHVKNAQKLVYKTIANKKME